MALRITKSPHAILGACGVALHYSCWSALRGFSTSPGWDCLGPLWHLPQWAHEMRMLHWLQNDSSHDAGQASLLHTLAASDTSIAASFLR